MSGCTPLGMYSTAIRTGSRGFAVAAFKLGAMTSSQGRPSATRVPRSKVLREMGHLRFTVALLFADRPPLPCVDQFPPGNETAHLERSLGSMYVPYSHSSQAQ